MFTSTQFQLDAVQHAPLLMLHPGFRGKSWLAAAFFENTQHLLYVAFQPSTTTLEALWQSLTEATADQWQTALPRLPIQVTVAQPAQFFIEKAQPFGQFRVIFDQFDYLEADLAIAWLQALSQLLPAQCQAIIIGRDWQPALNQALPYPNSLRLIPIDADRMYLDYSQPTASSHLLEVHGQGYGTVRINGRRIDTWQGDLPRTLFFYMVDHGIVTREAVFQAFWPKLSVDEATNVFHVTKRKINEILGIDLTIYQSGYYRLHEMIDLHYDVVKFLECVDQASMAEAPEAVALLQTALHLYRGNFLADLDAPWVLRRREILQSRYTEALTTLARFYAAEGQAAEAYNLALRAFTMQPYRDELAYPIMQTFIAENQPQRALQIYERLSTAMKRQGNALRPEKRTRQLADQARRGTK